ncbi:MAG: hypothetical protein ABEJ56_00125 [Candidatus Nanohaloarchaea archaeon]
MQNLQISDDNIDKEDLEKYTSHKEARWSEEKGEYQKKIWIKYKCRNCGHEIHKHKSVPDGHRGPSSACIKCSGKTLNQIKIAEAEIYEN